MLEEDILDSLTVKKTLDEIQTELKVSKKKLKRKLKSMTQEGIIEGDGIYYSKTKETRKVINYAPLIVLAIIVLLGFYLRIYHIDYPVIGYHNWKEEHYLGEARNFARDGFFKHGFFVPAWDYPYLDADPSGVHPDSFPTTSILVGILFKLFGPELWIARLVSILFSTGTIVLMYLIVKNLSKREDVALLTALLTAVNPLFIFFGRQVQLINPTMFFILLSTYFFLKWREKPDLKYLIPSAASFSLGLLTKYDHFIIVFPLLFIFPYKRLKEEKYWGSYLIAILLLSPIPAWLLYNDMLSKQLGIPMVPEGIDPAIMLTPQWQIPVQHYITDNFTIIGSWFAVFGIFILIYNFYRGHGGYNRFIMGYILGVIPWLIISARYLKGHSYHQYPITPLVIMLMAYFIISISDLAKKLRVEGREVKYVNWIFMIPFLLLLIQPINESISRQFNTQFIGLDIAGEYINTHSNVNERIFHSRHQSYGVLWHADRKGVGLPGELDEIKEAEGRNYTWILLYDWGYWKMIPFTCQNPEDEGCQEEYAKKREKLDYLKNNYALKQRALWRVPKQPGYTSFILLKKGGSFNETDLDDLFILMREGITEGDLINSLKVHNKEIKHRDYEYTKGNVRVYYVDLDE
jgi:hypothetical protein